MITPMLRIALAVTVLSSTACANHAKRSIALYESGDYTGALHAADDGLTNHPDDDALWGMKVRAALALGDRAGVAKAYEGYSAHRSELDKELLRDISTATIGQALASPSVKLKVAAIEAVEHHELHALADAVAERMEDRDDRVAAAASIAVLNGWPGARQNAGELLTSSEPEARRIIVDGIGRKVGKGAQADLEQAANDRDPRVRRAAIHWLGMTKDAGAIELLAKRQRDPDEGVRAAAAQALARIGGGDLVAFAKQALADHALSVRLAGVDLLAAAKADEALVGLADNPDPLVALQAAIAVRSRHPDLAQKAVTRALAADEPSLRAGAANMLALALDSAEARSAAQRLAGDPAVAVRLAAARVLVHTGDREAARTIFTAALGDADHGVQAAADLAELGDPRGLQALSAAMGNTDASARITAVHEHESAHRVTAGLVAALADDNALVRIEAAIVLATLAK
jgi:HEAT repeat protein